VKTLRPLRTATITLGGRQIEVSPRMPDDAQRLLDDLDGGKPIQLRSERASSASQLSTRASIRWTSRKATAGDHAGQIRGLMFGSAVREGLIRDRNAVLGTHRPTERWVAAWQPIGHRGEGNVWRSRSPYRPVVSRT
jgi:hypothetical protein